MNSCSTKAEDHPSRGSFSQMVVDSYASIMLIHRDDINQVTAARIRGALIAFARSDEEAAQQAGMPLEKIHHDRTTLNASDGLPLMVVAKTTAGRLYFSRPVSGWPRPGHRHPS